MEHKHTPGPWTFRKVGERDSWEIGLQSEIPECTGVRGDTYMCVSGICSGADARLMAASPDLLEALRAAYSDIQRLPGHTIDMLGRIEAAIAKAMGDQ